MCKCDQTKKFNIKFKYSVSNSKFQKYEGPTNSRSRVGKQGGGTRPLPSEPQTTKGRSQKHSLS